jgi:hypothetical protein
MFSSWRTSNFLEMAGPSLISGKAAPLLPRPDELVINAHLKDATAPIRGEGHGAELLGKRGQQLLRHPAGPNHVTTMPGLKNSSIGCNRPASRRMLHRRQPRGFKRMGGGRCIIFVTLSALGAIAWAEPVNA